MPLNLHPMSRLSSVASAITISFSFAAIFVRRRHVQNIAQNQHSYVLLAMGFKYTAPWLNVAQNWLHFHLEKRQKKKYANNEWCGLTNVTWLWTNLQLKLGSSDLHCSFLAKQQREFSPLTIDYWLPILTRRKTSSHSFSLVNTWKTLTFELYTWHIQ